VQESKYYVKGETLVILGVLFGFYVVGDLTTTIWLIANYPGGIIGESNPLAATIYDADGVSGMITSKVLFFMLISVTALILESYYNHEKRVMLGINFSILGLIAWSLIVVTTNVILIFDLSMQTNSYESEFLMKVYPVLLGIILSILIIMPKFIPKSLGKVEILLIVTVLLGPAVLSPGLYQHLFNEDLVLILTFLAVSAGIVGLLIYVMRRLYTRIIPKFQ